MVYGCIPEDVTAESISIDVAILWWLTTISRAFGIRDFVAIKRCVQTRPTFSGICNSCASLCVIKRNERGRMKRKEVVNEIRDCQSWTAATHTQILTETLRIDGVEEDHTSGNYLEIGRDASAFCQTILVIPTPICATDGANDGPRRLLTTSKPCAQFTKFHLCERGVGCGPFIGHRKETNGINLVHTKSNSNSGHSRSTTIVT